jgi:hypothetical protein
MKKFASLLIILFSLSVAANAQQQESTTINLRPGGYWSIYIKNKQGGVFNGAFAADTRVEVYILDDSNYNAWLNNQSFSSVYSSQRTTRGTFNYRLGKGIWHLVVSNRFSYIASKTVNLNYLARSY